MKPPFARVLVANRGEIACRVIRGIQELGGLAIAVHSDVDREALHVHRADLAVELGGAAPAESYLAIDKLLDAARAHGAEAIHPGYGFLSENADFADACEAAGFVFVGPNGEMMRRLGSKRLAKEVADAAGVAGVPGFDAATASDEELRSAAERIGFPLLIKASAGGGGRGMRLVERIEDFAEALAAGRREAAQAFGDDTMLLEKFVHPARHIEVQILGDGQGNAIALGERECSVQRRHQKLLEESPSPVVDDELRNRLEAAAVAIAGEVGYRNAGTVEFLLGPDGDFYFLEVNTRLQVEHPVTEFVHGPRPRSPSVCVGQGLEPRSTPARSAPQLARPLARGANLRRGPSEWVLARFGAPRGLQAPERPRDPRRHRFRRRLRSPRPL